MASAPKRPWYRLHCVTWVATTALLADFVIVQDLVHRRLGETDDVEATQFYSGWPFESLMPPDRGEPTTLRPLANAIVGALLVCATAFVCETFFRHERQLRISLKTLLIGFFVVALVLGTTRIEWSERGITTDGKSFIFKRRLFDSEYESAKYLPMLLSVACAHYALCSFAFWVAERTYRHVTRR